MTLTPAEVEAVAAKLSGTMFEAVAHSPWTDRIGFHTTNRTCRALKARGILADDNRSFTPLGLALYAHLKDNPNVS